MSNSYADDDNPRIAYTGSWTQIARTGPYANSLHSTTQSGASATVHFTGNLGRVFGSVPACNSSIHQESVIVAISLDDVSAGQVTLPCGVADRDNVIFYDSGMLSGGNQPHKLSVVNQLGNCLPFQFDAFSWEADSATASTTAVAAPLYGTLLPMSDSSITIIQGSSGLTITSMRGSSATFMAPSISGVSLAADAAASSSVQILTVNGIVTSMVLTPVTTGSSDTHGHSSSSSPPTGLIVGCIIGVLLFFIILILLLNFFRRRRNKMHAQQPLKADAITPFQLAEGAVNPSTGLLVDPEATERRPKFLLPTQDAKIGQYEASSSSAPREAEERRPLPDQERSLPSSESPPNVFRVPPDPIPSTISSPPSDMAPAYWPRHRSDMFSVAHLDARASRIAEAPPSYDKY